MGRIWWPRLTVIAQVIEFLHQSNHLTNEFKELKSEIFSSSTFTLLKKILPEDYIEVNDAVADVTASAEEKMKNIK